MGCVGQTSTESAPSVKPATFWDLTRDAEATASSVAGVVWKAHVETVSSTEPGGGEGMGGVSDDTSSEQGIRQRPVAGNWNDACERGYMCVSIAIRCGIGAKRTGRRVGNVAR